MCNYRPHAPLDHVRKDRKRRRQTLVSIRKHVDVGALAPLRVEWRVNRLLNFGPVEINRGLLLWKRATVHHVRISSV